MKILITITAAICILSVSPAKTPASLNQFEANLTNDEGKLKEAAFQILDTKCNVCHRKKNPFMVFTPKNMEKRISKIHKQVFVYKRMPKGNEIKLSSEEYETLKNWLESQSITVK